MLNEEQSVYFAHQMIEFYDLVRLPGVPWADAFDNESINDKYDAFEYVLNEVNNCRNYQQYFTYLFDFMADDDYIAEEASRIYDWLATNQ